MAEESRYQKILLRIGKAEYARIVEHAKVLGVSASQLIRQAVVKYLNDKG